MTVREILLWLSNKDDTIDYDSVERDIRKAVIRETVVETSNIGTQMTFAEKLDKAVEEYRQELAGNGVTITFTAAKRFLLMATLERMNEEPPVIITRT